MITIKGTVNEAIVYTDTLDEGTKKQIEEVCNEEAFAGSSIRIMPDTHLGKGAVIGTTMTIKDKVVPNLVGVDIGCGMSVARLRINKHDLDFRKLDQVIRKHVPSGFQIRKTAHPYAKEIDWSKIKCPIDVDRAKKSIGTLGGGNHFIEINKGESGEIFLVIHSGSRNFGKQVAQHYQKRAQKENPHVSNKELAYLAGQGMMDYLNDMEIAQQYATFNRRAMIEEIAKHMEWDIADYWESIHNFIEMETKILRKGATSAQAGELLLIPLNMRDGSIIAKGKGNANWNFSAPHGAGRALSRTQAKKQITMAQYEAAMRDVWTTSVSTQTLDEAPFAYKPMKAITDFIGDTVDIVQIIKPLYNFKN